MFSVLSLSTGSACSLWKAICLVRHNFPSMYSCLPCPNTFLSLLCLAVAFRFIFSIPFLGVEVRLGLSSWKQRWCLFSSSPQSFFPLPWSLLSCLIFQCLSALTMTSANPQYVWCISLWPMDRCVSIWFKCFLTCLSSTERKSAVL